MAGNEEEGWYLCSLMRSSDQARSLAAQDSMTAIRFLVKTKNSPETEFTSASRGAMGLDCVPNHGPEVS